MTEKHTRNKLMGRNTVSVSTPNTLHGAAGVVSLTVFAILLGAGTAAFGQAQNFPAAGGRFAAPKTTLHMPPLPAPPTITPNGTVVEDVIARVNDQIITRSEYERAAQQMLQEMQQQNATQADFEDRLHNLLRDMIDQQLLISKGKELGITGDAETIRRLDEIRKQNHLDSMEALEKAAGQQGVSFEDFKKGIRNQIITQEVVRDEVGRRLTPTRAQEDTYYAAHAKEFEEPEQVHLSEILIPTPENATDVQLSTAQVTADQVAAKLKAGTNFAELAKTVSGGPTASAGGELGDFKRGTLGQVLEDATFSLPEGGTTAPIRTRQGFVILHVDAHQVAGVPPLSAVQQQVQEGIYMEALQPALRTYLTKARDQAYVEISPGFVDAGSPRKTTKPADIAYTAYTPPPVKKKIQVKQRAEQVRAAKAQADLAAAREKLAEKQAAKVEAAAQSGSVKNAGKPMKQPKIRREKVRFGQAPRNSLPAGTTQTASVVASTPIAGQAPGVAMAPTESVTSITTGTGVETDNSDPLAPQSGPARKTRFSSRETDAEEQRAKTNLAKAEVKSTARPVAATPTETVDEKVQSAPLGLNGDTTKKVKKPKRKKGDPKERLQEAPKTVDTAAPVAPTVNPTLGASPTVAPPPPPPPSGPPQR